MTENYVIRSKIKDITKDMSVASDFADALDIKVKEMIEQAMHRAKANGRNTVMVRDI